MAESNITFEGQAPFELPVTQRAGADALDDIVLLTLYAIVPDQGPMPVPIRTAMTATVALALANQLGQAGLRAELKAAQNKK